MGFAAHAASKSKDVTQVGAALIGASSFNDIGWVDYDPTPNPAYARILSAVE